MTTGHDKRMHILEMIDSGRISPDEGVLLLKSLDVGDDPIQMAARPEKSLNGFEAPITTADQGEVLGERLGEIGPGLDSPRGDVPQEQIHEDPSTPPGVDNWRRWWMIPLWVGVAVAVSGVVLMVWALQTTGLGFWFVCAGVPFILGVVVVVLAWGSRNSPWLHLRVEQGPGKWPGRLAFSFPIPVRPAAWFLRAFGRYIPSPQGVGLDEAVLALAESTSPQNPIHIQVDEGEEGERVEIFIG